MAHLTHQSFVRTASVTTTSEVMVIEIKSDKLEQAPEQIRHQFNSAFLSMLVDRLSLANTRLSQLLGERTLSAS
jgi:CRP-like cAMP-binding protein